MNNKKIKHVTVLYNKVTSLTFGTKDDILADVDTVKTAKSVARVLKQAGYDVLLFEVNEDSIYKLPSIKTDFFLNQCGGIGNIPNSEHEVPKILDRIGIPYSGATSDKLQLTTDKVQTKKLFKDFGIPTPQYQVFMSEEDSLGKNLSFPLIVKPIAEDCSIGIRQDSVVYSRKKLKMKVAELIGRYKEPALVEKYINTRELNVTIVGNRNDAKVLPISEIVFGKSYEKKHKAKIVDFSAKWFEKSKNYHDTVGVCPADLKSSIRKKIEKYALLAYRKICGDAGYARLDIRLSEDGKIYFLEINLNPDISDGMGASRSAKAYGWKYTDFLRQIMNEGLNRVSA